MGNRIEGPLRHGEILPTLYLLWETAPSRQTIEGQYRPAERARDVQLGPERESLHEVPS